MSNFLAQRLFLVYFIQGKPQRSARIEGRRFKWTWATYQY